MTKYHLTNTFRVLGFICETLRKKEIQYKSVSKAFTPLLFSLNNLYTILFFGRSSFKTA